MLAKCLSYPYPLRKLISQSKLASSVLAESAALEGSLPRCMYNVTATSGIRSFVQWFDDEYP